jgi:tetratricopeptide (TPR) repeat protein
MFLRRHRERPEAELHRLADDAIDAALARDQDDLVALSMRGFLEMQSHAFADARETARGILRIRHDNTTALLLLGDAELELGAYPEAVDAYQRAADIRPDLRVYNRGAYARWLHGDSEGALELLELAIDAGSARDPESIAWCWVDVAWVEWHQGGLREARAALERALVLVPDYLPARRLEARLAWAENRHLDAIATMESVLSRQEQVGDILLLAEMLEAEGRAAEALDRAARAAALRREDPRALASHQSRHGIESEAALRATSREIETRQDVYTLAAHALALARAGRHDEARTTSTRALGLGTPDATLWLTAAAVQHLGGDDTAARSSLERAAALNLGADFFLAGWLLAELHLDPLSFAPAASAEPSSASEPSAPSGAPVPR